MKTLPSKEKIQTGVRNLDEVLFEGLPKGELTVFAGTPGSGKTILSQQIIFKNATPKEPALIFQTLSEPTAKTLRYLKQFSFFDQKKLEDGSVNFVDLGGILRSQGLEQAIDLLMGHLKKVKPAFVVIDSFKVFEDLAQSKEELRKFSYQMAINLMAWECTSFFLGEFSPKDLETNPLFSIIDGIITLKVRLQSGEHQRFIQVIKMRGTDHSRDEHSFEINNSGIEIYAPRLTILRKPEADQKMPGNGPYRIQMGMAQLDGLLGEGIPSGSTLLVSGASGTGKTLLMLEFIYRGAKEFNEKGIFFSFEETKERILANAKSMGLEIEDQIKKGNIEIVFIPRPEIQIEKHLLMIKDSIKRMGAKRVSIDSTSVFLYKVEDPQIAQEKFFQLTTLVQEARAVGLFATDIPYGSAGISRFGVEETMVDGVILLSSVYTEKSFTRERFLEIYKLRNTAHASGRHKMEFKYGGITIWPNTDQPNISKRPNKPLARKKKKPLKKSHRTK